MKEFFIQLARRFMAQTPWFQTVVKYLGFVAVFVGSIPITLTYLCTQYQLCDFVPTNIMKYISVAVMVAGAVSSFIAQLSVTEEAKRKALNEGKPIIDKII